MNHFYEQLYYKDPTFPFHFHYDVLDASRSDNPLHWHKALELLLFTDGAAQVHADMEREECTEGDLAVINSNRLHKFGMVQGEARYYCLMIDLERLELMRGDAADLTFQLRVRDADINALFRKLAAEMEARAPYFESAVKALAVEILVRLCRDYTVADTVQERADFSKLAMVKKVIEFFYHNCERRLRVDEIAENVGYSKYYVLHVFKELTGLSPIAFLNLVRCDRAEKLIAEGMSVGEAAYGCGFENLSYFSRTFRRYKGIPPSRVSPGRAQ